MLLWDIVFSSVGVLLAVAFFTLMERKMMGYMHYRKGPNKIILSGVSQPISDAVKLLIKEMIKLPFTKIMMFMMGPMISLSLMMMYWSCYSSSFTTQSLEMKFMVVAVIMSLSAYGFMLTSWGSNSKYTILGGHRVVAQIMSYEVCILIFIMCILYISSSFKIESLEILQEGMWVVFCMPVISLWWLSMCLAETNRTPFDLAEGESEIVSGFNTEYSGGLFAMVFISEYGMLMFMSMLSSILILGTKNLLAKTILISMVFIWSRCCFPRMRYDKLMLLCWKMALPFSLAALSLSLVM